MSNEFLPIGTVCTVNGGQKKLMIIAFLVNSETDDNSVKQYDYCGCLYPEGMLDSDEHYVFNHNEIDEIHYMGFVNEEEKEFKKVVREMLNAGVNTKDVDSINTVPPTQQDINVVSNGTQSTGVADQLVDIPILVQQQNVVNSGNNQNQ